MTVLIRLLVILVLLLGSTVSWSARGRVRGYQAGGGHHGQPKARAKQPKDRQKKPAPQPVARPDTKPIT